MKKLELRMYGLVNYQLTGIQMGIQYGHAVVRYGQMIKKCDDIIEVDKHLQTLKDNGVTCQDFYEPDLGDQLTSVVFIVDERVFNYVDYPQFEPSTFASLSKSKYNKEYNGWMKKMGGEKNVFLRNFLRNFKLA